MKLSDIGEFGFIERFSKEFRSLEGDGVIGIGDDCAVIPKSETESLVVTTDLLIENVHFLKEAISPFELGYKSLAVNLSDIAAMGAGPVGSFLSLGVPKDTDLGWLDAFFDGYRDLSGREGCPLLGGDTTGSEKIVVNIAVIGSSEKERIKFRSTAEVHDHVCLVDTVGDSAGGLQVLLGNIVQGETEQYLVNRHHMPRPMVAEGKWLSRQEGVHAMIDISDGVASDLGHILEESGKGASVDLEAIPLSKQLREASSRHGWDTLELALAGGEDYSLLFTVDEKMMDEVGAGFEKEFKRPLVSIGRITIGNPAITWTRGGKNVLLKGKGFQHF